MDYLFIYLLQLADIFNELVGAGIICSTIFGVVLCICFITTIMDGYDLFPDEDSDSDAQQLYKVRCFFQKSFIISLVALVVFNLIPTKQTLLLTGGLYLGKRATKAITVDEKIKKVDEIINLQLDKYIKELTNQQRTNKNGK